MLYSISSDTFIYRGFEVNINNDKSVDVKSGSNYHFYDDISSAIADINKREDAANDLKNGDSLTFCANNYTFISYDDQNKVIYAVMNDNNATLLKCLNMFMRLVARRFYDLDTAFNDRLSVFCIWRRIHGGQ